MGQLSSRNFRDIYEKLEIDISDLGIVMLDVEPFEVLKYVPNGEADLFYGKSRDLRYAQGAVAEKSAHVTLLMGLMASAESWRPHIEEVLDGWTPPELEIANVGVFPGGGDSDEPYSVIIGHIRIGDALLEGHERLSFLPHIDTFPKYQAHLTLAYVKDTPGTVEKWIRSLNKEMSGRKFQVTALNFGDDD